MDDMHLNEEQSAILQQYKEILNESDDDMARATLESLGWDLAKAIEASAVTDNCTTTNSNAPGVVDMTIGEEAFPQYERMDTHDASVQIIDESNHDHNLLFARLNAKVKMENEDPTKPVIIDSKPCSSSFITKKAFKNGGAAQADDLSLDCYITSDSSNGLQRKTSGERVDSGSGSVCSLSNPAQASTSATADVVIIRGSLAGPSSAADKNSRKEKKRCKMSANDNKEEVTVSFESEESDQDDVEDMDDSIVYLTDEDTKKEDSPNVSFNDQIPLMPTDFSTISEAMQNFTSVFEARYGGNFAPFFQGSLQEALVEAFDTPRRNAVVRSAMERRPLAIYLHNDTSIASNIFAQNVMCSESVSSLLKCQFIIWAWDMSQNENRQKLYDWLSASNMTDVCQNIKTIHRSKYPLLVVLVKDRLNIYPATVIKGHDGAAQAVEKLMQGLDMYLRIKNKDVAEEQSRFEREQIRQEQVEEYEKSLAVDRAKQEELAKQRQREREEELQKQRQEEQKLVRQAELASTLPSEPSESEPNAITIRIRFPTGEHKMRRFRMGEAVNWLVTFVESIGFDMEEHRIWTSDMPKRDLTTFDLSKTFTELNWPRREQVTVEEK